MKLYYFWSDIIKNEKSPVIAMNSSFSNILSKNSELFWSFLFPFYIVNYIKCIRGGLKCYLEKV